MNHLVDDAGAGLFGDVGVAEHPESAFGLEVSEVVEDGLVGLALQGHAGKLLKDGVLVLGLEHGRQTRLHHDVDVAVGFLLQKKNKNMLWLGLNSQVSSSQLTDDNENSSTQ